MVVMVAMRAPGRCRQGRDGVLEPAKKFYLREQSLIAYVDDGLGLIDDIDLVLGHFARLAVPPESRARAAGRAALHEARKR